MEKKLYDAKFSQGTCFTRLTTIKLSFSLLFLKKHLHDEIFYSLRVGEGYRVTSFLERKLPSSKAVFNVKLGENMN